MIDDSSQYFESNVVQSPLLRISSQIEEQQRRCRVSIEGLYSDIF